MDARRKKTGGRQKGTRNKVTAQREAEIAASGLTPLEYMLKVLRDENDDTPRRDEMAKAAAPYCHPRLRTMDAKVSVSSLAEALDGLKAQNASSSFGGGRVVALSLAG